MSELYRMFAPRTQGAFDEVQGPDLTGRLPKPAVKRVNCDEINADHLSGRITVQSFRKLLRVS